MISITGRGVLAALLALSAIGVGAGFAASGKGGDTIASDDTAALGCAIGESASGGQIIVSPIARSATSTTGSYQFSVRGGASGGSSSVNQGGNFKVAAGGSAALGSLSLAGGDARYEATLDVTAGGASAHCSKTIPSS